MEKKNMNRLIYWLFSSKKWALKRITCMYRVTPYTAERVRSKYRLPYIEQMQLQINFLESHAASFTTVKTKQLTALRETIEECRDYYEHLQIEAEDTNVTGFDLGDGLAVNYAKYGEI